MKTLAAALLLLGGCLFFGPPAFAICDDLGEVSESVDCGLVVTSLLTGEQFFSEEENGLAPGQIIAFGGEPTGATAPCPQLTAISFDCLTVLSAGGQCIDPDLIDLDHECSGVYEPVCGCDGVTYPNLCQAVNWYGLEAWVDGPCPGDALNCTASFMFAYLDPTTVVLYNNSTAFSDYSWSYPDEGVVQYQDDVSITISFPSGAAEVCLEIWNEEGCADTLCLFVHSDSEDEMCQQTDCVWPGDADGDAKANIYDLLNIGLGFATSGPPRPFFPVPNNPIAWAPNFSEDWGNWVGPVNYKHLDCNGNGDINEADVAAIDANYTPEFDYSSTPVEDAPPIYLDFDVEEMVIDDNTPDFFAVTADLYVGDNLHPAFDVHGLALQVLYPYDLVVPNSVSADYDDNSFFGHIHDILTVNKDLNPYNVGIYDLAFSRKGGDGVNGYGKVATLSFVVDHDIIDGRAEEDNPFDLLIQGVKFIDAEGNLLDYQLADDTASVNIINDGLLAAVDAPGVEKVAFFPNPASETLHIDLGKIRAENCRLEIFNSLGERIHTRRLSEKRTAIALDRFEPGVYWFKLQTGAGLVSRKIMVKRK